MKRIFRYLLTATVTTVLIVFTSCVPTDIEDRVANKVALSAGETISASTTSQFLMITSAESWNVAIQYNSDESASSAPIEWCTLSKVEGKGNANVIMSFSRNALPTVRSLRLTVTFASKQTIALDLVQRGASTDVADAHPAWLELPSSNTDDNHLFVTHYLPKADGGGRSYSIFYDTEHYIPTWVAYTLHTSNITGSGGRTNVWGFDPKVSVADQVDLNKSYSGYYDRGHMLPSASRLTSDAANIQTFYYTNMTPQMSSLNQKGWATIEGQVRGWKGNNSDTLYVVTGAVLRTVGGNEPIVDITAANGTFSSKPNYYYKALLKLTQRNGSKNYQAMAIWVEHKARTDGASADDIITIDELETRTGIDFFSNLDEATQSAVESSWSPSAWGF